MKNRGGFTLVETIIAMLLGAVVMASIYQMINIQEKTTRHQYAIAQTSDNAQMAMSLLTNDLKELSARDGDIVAVDSTSITFRALRKAGVVCTKINNSTIDVWELGAPFAAADSVLVFADGASATTSSDDTWVPGSVSATAAAACAGNPLAAPTSRRLSFVGTPFGPVQSGALVRSFERTRYRLTDSAGFGRLLRTQNGVETPIIEGLATAAEGGLRMRFFDSAGVAIPLNNLTARRTDIMRVQLKVAGKAVTSATKTQGNRFTDSLKTQVYLRGNARGQ